MNALNLEKIEDVFFCIDVLSKSKIIVGGEDSDLGQDINKIIHTLMKYSESEFDNYVEKKKFNKNIIEENIVDLFTGEILYNDAQ